jgi:hypothetical protein
MQIDFDNGILYFRNIFSNNISKPSKHKVGATFIGINTNISGKNELHIYICLFPFANGYFPLKKCQLRTDLFAE